MGTMTHQWLTAQEVVMRAAALDDMPLEVGAVALFEAEPLRDAGGRLRLDDLRRRVETRLGRVPRFHQIIVEPPFAQGRSAWVDAPRFDVADHVRAATLPPPGGDPELRDFVRRVLDTPLDRRRPPWEIWLVDGLEGDRVAMVPKVSHVAVDGTTLLVYALALLDADRDAPEDVATGDWVPAPPPNRAMLLAAAMADTAWRTPVSALRVMRDLPALARPRSLGAMTKRAPRLPVTRPFRGHHDVAWVSLPLDDLKGVAHARGATLNDVVVSVVADALAPRMEATRARVVVPVSTHGPAAADATGNAYTLVIADVPLGVMPPGERLDLVHGELTRAKASGQADTGRSLFGLGDLVPQAVLHALVPPLLRHQPFANLAVTNIAGSPMPLYLLGARMLAAHPLVSLTGNLGLIVGVLSHERHLCVGVTADADAMHDVDAFAADIADAARTLVASARYSAVS
jgi:WS/DGAT/MGAT family acyltransferase